MAHGVELEVAERDLLHLAVGGMVVDPVLVAAETVAGLQHRRMLVGGSRELVEPAAGKRAEAVEMGLEPARSRRAADTAAAGRAGRGRRHRNSARRSRARCDRRRDGALATGLHRTICWIEARPWSHLGDRRIDAQYRLCELRRTSRSSSSRMGKGALATCPPSLWRWARSLPALRSVAWARVSRRATPESEISALTRGRAGAGFHAHNWVAVAVMFLSSLIQAGGPQGSPDGDPGDRNWRPGTAELLS